MQTFTELVKIPNLSLALGFFDGVHRGHQAVIKQTVQSAKENNTKSAVITFSKHPCCYLYDTCPKYLLTRRGREEKIAELGVDYLFELDFEKLSWLTADEYLKDILIRNFTPISITTGWNHHFGRKQSGDVRLLEKESKKFGYDYLKIQPQKLGIHTISSTAIRDYLFDGLIEDANNMLGYKFSIKGEVIEGQKLGRKIGFRTANLVYPKELVDLPFGVYAVNVKVGNEQYNGITNFGIRPTVSESNQRSLETHILNFDKDIYGEEIEVSFLKMLRQEKKFSSLEELQKQISIDIKQNF